MLRLLQKFFGGGDAGNFALVRRLLTQYGYGHRRSYALAFLFMGVAAACTALTAWLIGDVVNQTYLYRNFSGLVLLSGLVVLVFTLKGAATYGQSVLLARIGNRIVAENQNRIFEKLLSARLDYFSDRHSSEFLMRVNAGARAAAVVLNLLITAVGRDLLTLIGLMAVMVYQDPLLSLVGLVVMPPAILVIRKLMRRSRGIAKTEFEGGIKILETLQETIQGFRIVKAFGLEPEMRRRLTANVATVEQAANKLARVAGRSNPLMETLGGIAIAMVLLYGGYRVLALGATPGEFISFITAFLLAYEPAKRLARLNVDLSAQYVAVSKLFETLDDGGGEGAEDYRPASVANGRVEFRHISFSYRDELPVLQDLSFAAEPDKLTALVGPSGGGKSTILSLILRFYEPQAGVIEIGGKNIVEMSRTALREQIAYVGQDVFLFNGSVRENIRFGRLDATDEEIVAAATAAYAHAFILALPQGYDTPVGEAGSLLSGGQRQRIAVARALVRNAPIILLDEATSSLDTETEREVQLAIEKLRAGRTCLAIAHRLNTIAKADTIYVIENGHVTETGTHRELIKSQGRYADFCKIQFGEEAAVAAE